MQRRVALSFCDVHIYYFVVSFCDVHIHSFVISAGFLAIPEISYLGPGLPDGLFSNQKSLFG
jgi:hypothetical protein